LDEIESQIAALDARLNAKQVLDLTWAIRGLLITLGGVLWGLGT